MKFYHKSLYDCKNIQFSLPHQKRNNPDTHAVSFSDKKVWPR